MKRVFLLSPAHTGGERAQLLFNPEAGFDLARRLQRGHAVPLGEVFSFLSGLYFRGKLTYARAFARPPAGVPGVWVITTNQGLVPADRAVTLEQLRAFSEVEVDHGNPLYREPLERVARRLAAKLPGNCEVILLGSISTRKYVETLVSVFGERLKFPVEFVGRGDMSRGGLLLRCVAGGSELEYAPVAGAVRHGPRPPKLERRSRRQDRIYARFSGCVRALETLETVSN